jgi:hypothetical protein
MTTNELGNDPDVRTAPVFHFYDKAGSVEPHMPLQNLFFVAILSLLDVFWRFESVMVLSKNFQLYKWNLLRLAIHYMLLGLLLAKTTVTIIDIVVLMLIRGFMTAIVVFANHYPEDRLPRKHNMGLFEQTLRTSRNTTGLFAHHEGGVFRSIFNECTGFLSMQIEHHLAPTIPSGNLMILRPLVKALAEKYGIPYQETSILQATRDNITKLTSVNVQELKKLL